MQELRDLEVRERVELDVYIFYRLLTLAVGLEEVLPVGAGSYSYRYNPATPGETPFCSTMPLFEMRSTEGGNQYVQVESEPTRKFSLESGGGLSKGNRMFTTAVNGTMR